MIGLTNRRFADAAIIFPATLFVIVRRLLGGPIFRGEFALEDCILLLALASAVASPNLKPLIQLIVAGATGITMALIASTRILDGTSSPRFVVSAIVFALMAAYAATRALIEVLKLLRRRGAKI
jgi:hypothetical protein